MSASAFISHSWSDKPLARKLSERLRAYGVRVWLDEAEIKIGDSLIQKIRMGIDSVDYVIALLSPKSCQSEWVSKELDIAMNQEIEGRRVKVLPILASHCDLPMFLKGKLYADFSSGRKFDLSFPRLLESLGVSETLIRSAKPGVGKAKRGADLSWVYKLERAIMSGNNGRVFEILLSIKPHDSRSALREYETLQHLCRAAEESWPLHIRVRALEILGKIGDPRFGYYVDPFLSDINEHIVVKALEALTELESFAAADTVLSLLMKASTRRVQAACLRYFAKVPLEARAEKLSLLAACKAAESSAISDPGLTLLVTEAVAKQVDWGASEMITFIVERLRDGDDSNRLTVLQSLRESPEEFFRSPKYRHSLGNAIMECTESQDSEVQAAALMLAVLMKDALPQFKGNVVFWSRMEAADRLTVHEVLEDLVDYRLSVIFDEPDDCYHLSNFLGRFDSNMDSIVDDIMAGIASPECIRNLAQRKVRLSHWRRNPVLHAMLKVDELSSEDRQLLDAMDPDFGKYNVSGKLLYALARYRSVECSLDQLALLLPDPADILDFEADIKATVVRELNKILPDSKGGARRAISRVLSAVEKEDTDENEPAE